MRTSQLIYMNDTSLPRTVVFLNKSFNYLDDLCLQKLIFRSKIILVILNYFLNILFYFFEFSCDKPNALIVRLIFLKEVFMYPKTLLWELRTNLPMHFVLMELEDLIHIPYKESEGFIRFLCQNCNEIQATINPKNNLSHCFSCDKNFNNIDLMIASGYTFSRSVEILMVLLEEFKKGRQTEARTSTWQ